MKAEAELLHELTSDEDEDSGGAINDDEMSYGDSDEYDESAESDEDDESHQESESDEEQPLENSLGEDEEHECSYCTISTVGDAMSSGKLMNQGEAITENVRTNSFNKKRAYVIPKGSVGLDSMSSVDVFG